MKKNNLTPAVTRCGNTEFRWGERTYIMGIINMSPDSFSGDGFSSDIAAVREQVEHFLAEGADIIDIGGESTRPGSQVVSIDEELERVIPVIKKLAAEITVPISIDTSKSAIASRAMDAGAGMINDIWGLKKDPNLSRVAAAAGVPIILASNQRGQTCKFDIMAEIIEDLKKSISIAEKAGVLKENIIIDPGIG
ncbi:MAG: dihydropteroate synthase, partial [Gammaproteobacteria bacterium]|nr:dihydropteroate synthase [Gammaproteobacteria bacterium]